jgi:hypothetical protein
MTELIALTPALSHPMGEGESFPPGWQIQPRPINPRRVANIPSPPGGERVRVRGVFA